jgi:translation initiation factor 1
MNWMNRERKKKIENTRAVSLNGARGAMASIGEIMGREASPPPREKPAESQKAESKITEQAAMKSAILRRESAGRGGRTVTSVEPRPPLTQDAAENLAKLMRKNLGCGSHVEGAKIILQGDIGDRAEAWLMKRGVSKITRGS